MRLLGRQARVALDHAVLHFDRAAHGVDHAAELDDAAVAGALDDAAVMEGDGRIDQVAAQRPEPRQNAILVRSREPAIADNIRNQNRRNFPGLAHGAPSGCTRSISQNPLRGRIYLIEPVEPREGSRKAMTEGWLWTI